jgi:hypothetical protein
MQFFNRNNEYVSSTNEERKFNKICYSSCKESPKPFRIAGTNQCDTECPPSHPYRFEKEKTCYENCSSITFIQHVGIINIHKIIFVTAFYME